MSISRREFIKNNAATAAAAAAGMSLPLNMAMAASEDEIRWDKAPCRAAQEILTHSVPCRHCALATRLWWPTSVPRAGLAAAARAGVS